jgi:hypothetical protein
VPVLSLRQATVDAALARGRTCYDHLAGRLGVSIVDAMGTRGLLSREAGLALTPDGVRWLDELGARVPAGRRPYLRDCIDWTERRPHLAGRVGAALCERAFELGWVVRVGSSRAVRVTAGGARGLGAALGLPAAVLEPR